MSRTHKMLAFAFLAVCLTVGVFADQAIEGVVKDNTGGVIPGVTVIESGQACCGIAGTYGLKKEKYDIAQKVGQPLFDMIKETNPQLATCDTETCRWQIRKGSGAAVVHPIEIIHAALGLSELPAGVKVSG